MDETGFAQPTEPPKTVLKKIAMNTCQNCDLKLTSSEVKSGKCPSCKQKLNVASAGSTPTSTRSPSSPATRTGDCEITGVEANDLQQTYLRVVKTSVSLGGSVRFQYVNVRVKSSAAAYRRGRHIMWVSMLIALSWLILPFVGVVALVLLESAGLPQNVLKMLAVPVILAVPVLMVAAFIVMPIYRRRQLNKLLPERLNSKLKELSGCKDWGFRYNVAFLKKLPSSETALPASILKSLGNAGVTVSATI